mmetsp:Transcript_18761/g.31982  ORF Transcript_18761/g.31982 Transcript_18761/m.31982 type:complete len:266 (+) Transcript_18761:998-1795(+)
MVSCTPWKTNFLLGWPCTARMPLHLKMSLAFSARRSRMNMLKRYSSNCPLLVMPTLLTSDKSCSFLRRRLGFCSNAPVFESQAPGASSRLWPASPAVSPCIWSASSAPVGVPGPCADAGAESPASVPGPWADVAASPVAAVPGPCAVESWAPALGVVSSSDVLRLYKCCKPGCPAPSSPATTRETGMSVSVSRNSGSTSSARCTEKVLVPSTSSKGGRPVSLLSEHSMMRAVLLMVRIASSTSALSLSETKSTLLSKIRSENAIC